MLALELCCIYQFHEMRRKRRNRVSERCFFVGNDQFQTVQPFQEHTEREQKREIKKPILACLTCGKSFHTHKHTPRSTHEYVTYYGNNLDHFDSHHHKCFKVDNRFAKVVFNISALQAEKKTINICTIM